MPTTPGLDTTDALSSLAILQLKKLGIGFVIKYCSDTSLYPNKRLTHAERADLVANGIASGFVFERGNTYDYFSASQGGIDAETVIAYFQLLGVPAGKNIACFLAVDFDATIAEINGAIMAYATRFHDVLKAAGYLTGVYGSGDTCRILKAAGVVHYTWKAQSTGWGGYAYFGWDIRQNLGAVEGLASDPDEANNMDWAWGVAA